MLLMLDGRGDGIVAGWMIWRGDGYEALCVGEWGIIIVLVASTVALLEAFGGCPVVTLRRSMAPAGSIILEDGPDSSD